MFDALEDRTNHPWIVVFVILCGCLLAVGLVAEFVLGNGLLAGFMAIYAIILFALAVFALGASLLLRVVSNARSGKLGG